MIDLRKPAKLAWQDKEDALQIQCMRFLKKELFNRGEPQVAFHAPNGGNRSQREAGRFKLMGVLSGVPDVCLPLRTTEHCGVWCELKDKKGKPSEQQIDFMEAMTKEGWLCVIINDLETFKEVFNSYLDERK